MAKSSNWHSIEESNFYPPENQTVLLYNETDKCVWIGCQVYVSNEGWFWAVSNGTIYEHDGNIVSECEIDDIEVTHWAELPRLPECKITNPKS